MKKLFLHIGLPKTGSSAIQSWLSANSELLRLAHSTNYADLEPEAKLGRITSGNGRLLVRFCRLNGGPKAVRPGALGERVGQTYFAGAERCIVSSELLADTDPTAVAALAAALKDAGIEVHVVAFVRSIYDHCWSWYQQQVKRHGYCGSFADYAGTYRNPQVRALQAWRQSFTDFSAINYDTCRQWILEEFLSACGIHDVQGAAVATRIVNRSLSAFELELLLALNRTAADKGVLLSRRVSDALIHSRPEESACFLYDPQIAESLQERFREDSRWMRETFPEMPSVSIDTASGRESRGLLDAPLRAEYALAMDAVVSKLLRPPTPPARHGRRKQQQLQRRAKSRRSAPITATRPSRRPHGGHSARSIKAAIINDTYGKHAGCQLVMETFREQLARVGVELLGTVHKTQHDIDRYPGFVRQADLVIVNGEGSIHHGKRLDLVEVAARFPAVLINCVYEATPPVPALRMFRFVAARESLSAAELRAQGVNAETMPDVVVTSGRLRHYLRESPVEDVGITDNVVDRTSGFTALVGEGNVSAYLDALSRYRRLCVGRFHGALIAAVLGIPFSAWASNTHKTRGLLMDMGIPQLYRETQQEALTCVPQVLDSSVTSYVENGRRLVNAFFDRLHSYV